MPAPLTPADCDLRDFPRMMIDIPRLFASEFDAVASDAEWRFGVTLWLKSFHQVPAASLPDDDAQLARICGLGRDVKTWRKCRPVALRGWVKADDGLLYHPVVAEISLEAWLDKLTQRLSSGAGNASRWGVEFDPEPIKADIAAAAVALAALNPKSRALSKQQAALALRKSRRDTPAEVPAGQQDVPSGSQGKGREGIEDTEPDGSGGEPPDRLLVELSELPVDKGAWRLAKHVLVERGGKTTAQAGDMVGKWLKAGATHQQVWAAAEAAWRSGTEEPIPYITAALKGEKERGADPMLQPEDWRQRKWMEEFVEGRFAWSGQRGPEPGQPGCRVRPEIQREFGVEPASPRTAA